MHHFRGKNLRTSILCIITKTKNKISKIFILTLTIVILIKI